jgi:DNA-binding Lrp family transcriptional regulator
MTYREEIRTVDRSTYKDRIVELLKRNARGLTDNQISRSLGGTQQQTNVACRELERSGLIVRQRRGKPARIHNISMEVLRNGGEDDIPTEWQRKLHAMVRVNGETDNDLLDEILSRFGGLILEETPEHEMIVSLIRSKEGRSDRDIMDEALRQYLDGRIFDYEPWEMKAQIIAEKRRETQEEVLDAAVTEFIAGEYERAMRAGGDEWIRMMRRVRGQSGTGESVESHPAMRNDLVDAVEGRESPETPSDQAAMPGANPNVQQPGRPAEVVPNFNVTGVDDSAFGV